MPRAHSRLVCAGCGYAVPDSEPLPFSCPNAGASDDTDHVLQRVLDPAGLGSLEAARRLFADDDPNPFLRYRQLLHSYITARDGGLSDANFVDIVEALDAAVARVASHGFCVTPTVSAPELAEALGVTEVLIKDETGNVTGTHKGRHLMATMVWLQVAERVFPEDRRSASAPLAISSCGNAALAAAAVARAAGRQLETFVPPHASPLIVERLESLGADLTICVRRPGERGDPCHRGFRSGVAGGRLPFSCQGPDNALALDGGRTLAWELVSDATDGVLPDDLYIQVGGGALASSCIQGLREARALGVLQALPRIIVVQAETASPLHRAHGRVIETVLERFRAESDEAPAAPVDAAERAVFIRDVVPESIREDALRFAASHRSSFMWPWETEPQSVSDAILDDETYDWLEVLRGMLETGGFPVLVSDDTLREAHTLAHQTTGIPVDINGTSGLAGCLLLARQGLLGNDRSVALLFTGVERGDES